MDIMADKQEDKFDKRAAALRDNLKRRKDLAKEKKNNIAKSENTKSDKEGKDQ